MKEQNFLSLCIPLYMSEWVKHVKAYQAKHGGTYGESMHAARASWKGVKKTSKKQKGSGILDKLKAAVSAVKSKLFFPPDRLPAGAERVFNKNRDAVIQKIMVNRTPINSMVNKALNLLSLGKFGQAKKDMGYDSMFHLSMVLYTNKGKFTVEKNERINIASGGSGGGESIDIAFSGKTFDEFLNKGREKMGDHAFFQYNAFTNNCQDFVAGILQANGALSAASRTFIKQDAETLLKKMPGYLGRVAQAATDLGGKVSQALTGQGRKKKKKN